MHTYQAAFLVLLVFGLGDLVGAVTKAKISSIFVIMMGFLVLFMTGAYPADIIETAGFGAVCKFGQMMLLFNMGTTVDIATLKREWKTVVCALTGMLVAIVACLLVSPLVGLDCALASAPSVNGGILATSIMVEACDANGLTVAAALVTFVYAVQKFIGTLPASNCGLKVANELVADLRAKHAADPNYSWYAEQRSNSAAAKTSVCDRYYRKYLSTFICLTIGAGIVHLSNILGQATNGWIGATIWCMVFGIVLRNLGLIPASIMVGAKANGFFSFLSLCPIIPSLAKIDFSQLSVIGFKALVIFAAVVILTIVVFCFTPAWRIAGSKNLSIGIAMCQMIGYPGTELIATEIMNAVAETEEEKDAITARVQTAYVISGFTSVTIFSVFIASFLAKLYFHA